MNTTYAAEYRNLYRNHWWWRARERAILEALEGTELPTGRFPILDVGCGDGLIFEALDHLGDVEGVEADPTTIAPESRWRDRIAVQPFDESFQPGKQYGLILMLDVLEHLPRPADALRHALSILQTDGKMLVTVPAFNALWTTHDDVNHHVTRYTKTSFRQLAEAAGLRIETLRYLFHWTCPVKLAIHLKERCIGTDPQPARLPPSLVNRVCLGLSRMEQRTISRWPMPFGSSLLAVGRATG